MTWGETADTQVYMKEEPLKKSPCFALTSIELLCAADVSHKTLCRIAAKWLRNSCKERCPVVFVELVTAAFETPDVFGCNSSNSIVIEVKRSRSDFLRDKKKFFRLYPEMGVGDFRYYLCPNEIIKPDDVPEKWGLIWVGENQKCKVVKEILTGNINSQNPHRFEKNARNERAIMYSALRRLQ